MTLKRYLYEKLYVVYYSIKELIFDVLNLLEEFKKPRMWSAILYGTFFVAAYTRNFKLMKCTLPLIFIMYLIRQKSERKYINEIFKKDLRKNIDSDIVKCHYETYKKQCYFSHKVFLEFDNWKKIEVKKINTSDQDAQH